MTKALIDNLGRYVGLVDAPRDTKDVCVPFGRTDSAGNFRVEGTATIVNLSAVPREYRDLVRIDRETRTNFWEF